MEQFLKITLFVIFSISLHGQNYLLDDGENAWGIKGQYTSYDVSNVVGLVGNYTVKGKLTFDFGLGRETVDNSDLKSTSYLIGASHLIFKQGVQNMPISLAFGGSFQYSTFNNLDVNVKTYILGSRIFHSFRINNKAILTPTASVSWGKVTASSGSISESASDTNYAVGLNFMYHNFYIEPRIAFADGDSQWFFVLGYVFKPSKTKIVSED